MIATETQRITYTGGGPALTYGWKVFSAIDLRVIKRNALGAVSVLTHLVDYTVTGVGDDAGGSVVLTAGPIGVGESITIRRARLLLQNTDVRNQGQFFAGIHEDAFDRAEMDAQFLKDEVDRSIKLPETEAGTPGATVLPRATDRASKVLGFDASGNVIAMTTIPSGAVVVTAWAQTLLDDVDAATARATLGGICPRSIAAGSGISVVNGDGVAGDPTISAANLSRAHMAADTRTVHYAPAAPAAPADGQFWWDTTVSRLKRYRLSDTSWREYLASDEISAVSAAIPDQWLTGLGLDYVSASVIAIRPGAAVDDTGAAMIRLSATQNVDITVTGANGRDAGAVADAWWYVWLIRNPVSGGVAGLVSLSATAPTMPAGYTQKRWLGALRHGAVQWRAFYTTGDGRDKTLCWKQLFELATGVNIVVAPTAFATTDAIPPYTASGGRCAWGIFSASAYNPPGGAAIGIYWVNQNNGGLLAHRWLMDDPPNLSPTHRQVNSSHWEMPLFTADAVYAWVSALPSGGCVYYLHCEGFRYRP